MASASRRGRRWTGALVASLLCLHVADAARADSIELSWPAADDARGYVVERRPADGTWAQVARLAAARSSWADTVASPGRTWCYRVYARGRDGGLRLHAREHCVAPAPRPDAPDAAQRRVRVRGGWLQEVEP